MPFLLIRIHEFITHHPVVQDLASQAPLEILQESVRIYIVLPKSISFSWKWSDLNLSIYFSEVNIRMSVRPGDDLQVHVFENLVPWTILIWVHLLQTSASCHLAFTLDESQNELHIQQNRLYWILLQLELLAYPLHLIYGYMGYVSCDLHVI